MDRSTHEKVFEVTSADIDDLDHVNNLAYLKWVLEIAKEHWFTYSTEELNDQFYWVVLSHYIEYKKPCFLGEELLIKTQVGSIDGAKWPRKVWIYRPDGKLAINAETVWCLMEKETNRPVRVTDEVKNTFIEE